MPAVTFNPGDYNPGISEIRTGEISVSGTTLTDHDGGLVNAAIGQQISIEDAGAGGTTY